MLIQKRRRRIKNAIYLIATSLLYTLLYIAHPADIYPQKRDKGLDELISMNFNDLDIVELVRLISEWSGKNYLLDQRIRGKVTIVSPKRVTKREALQIFHSILYANDLAVVEVGNITKIVPAAETRQSPIETVKGEKKLMPSEDFATFVIPIEYGDANQIAGIIRNLISRNAFLQVYPETNLIILIETKANFERLKEIIQELDKLPFTFKTEIVRLKYSTAQEVSGILTQITQTQRKPGRPLTPQTQPRIIPEPRTNSIIIAAEPQDVEYIKEILSQIDVPVEGGEVNVIYLKYSKAEEISSILQNLIAGGIRGVPGQAQVVQAPVRIAADKSTNSLIVLASPQDFEKIKDIVDKIDIERKQVFVSAAIVEVSSTRLAQYGLSFFGAKDFETKVQGETKQGVGIFGGALGTPLPFAIIDPQKLGAISGLLLGFTLPPATVNIGGQTVSVPPLAAILQALAADSHVDILSTPQILTLDNKEAEIRVATNIPFPTGQIITAAGAGGAAVPTITIQRQDVGIILKITPHTIERTNRLILDVNIEISDVAEEAPAGLAVQQLGIATIKRSSTTSVLVDDGQTIVIGGLMRTRKSSSRTKVPILGDIPVIGVLFRSSKSQTQKSNLIIFLTPKIIEKSADAEQIREYKIQEDIKFRKEEGIE